MKTIDPAVLKKIVHEVIGANSSKMLLNKACSIIDEEGKDYDSMKQACHKVENLVGLFVGKDKAHVMGRRFQETLN